MQFDPLVILIACGVLIAVFVRAIWHKLSDFDVFKASFADYEILPQNLVRSGVARPSAGRGRHRGGPGDTADAAGGRHRRHFAPRLYGGAIAVNLRRGRYLIDCGCGGPGQGLSWFLVARNAILAGIAVHGRRSAGGARHLRRRRPCSRPSVVTVWLLILASEQAARK